MLEKVSEVRGRTLLAGKIVYDFGQSTIDCVVRRISDRGATVTIESSLGIPEHCHLLIAHDGPPRSCKRVWQSGRELGLEFESHETKEATHHLEASDRRPDSVASGQMLALRSAMDEVETGVLLLDSDLRAQFINRAFRKMWQLPDALADSRPSFVALLRHARDTGAHDITASEMDAYISEPVSFVRAGDRHPRDLRRTNGEVIRMQCAVLPNGGRMLSYTYVTDIVHHSDELELLRNALDNISDGVLLLDTDLRAQFMNRKVREYFGVTGQQLANHPTYLELLMHAPDAGQHGVPPDQLDALFARRVEAARSATPTVHDTVLPDGRNIRAHCEITAAGGRMMTFCDVTDLIRNAELLEKLATVDSMTGLYNRRQFMALAEAEWSRFLRYQRPLSMLMLDIDHFKSVNDRFGHAVGDETLVSVAEAFQRAKRGSDIAGRIGGEEFTVLLPETDAAQALVLAERMRESVAAQSLCAQQARFNVTVSIGLAEASAGMSGIEALLRAADEALYQAKEAGRNRTVTWTAPAASNLAAE